jgi:hypothetical protein
MRAGPREASEVVQSSDPPNDGVFFLVLAWLVCILLFLVVDIFICPVMFGPEPGLAGKVVIGMFVAQAGLYASWVVLAPFPLGIRVTTASLLGLVWLVTMVGSCVSFEPYRVDYPRDIAIGCGLVPLVAIGFLAPLSMVQGWFRWQMRCPVSMAPENRREGFRTRDIFIGTTVVALALGSAQVASTAAYSDDLLIAAFMWSIGAAIISLFVVLPLMAATLRAQRVWLVLPVTIILQLAVFLGAIVVLHAVYKQPDQSQAMWLFGPIFVVLCVCLSTVMLVVRRFGYRLVWG